MKSLSFTRKTIWIIFAVLMTVSLSFLYFTSQRENKNFPRGAVVVGKTYALEIADTPEKQAQGLGSRENLCQRCAMLFVFHESGQHSFWMRGMLFPLDIVWLTGNRVVHIERNVPSSSQEIFTPGETADRVLELNAGKTENLEIGESVQFLY